MKKAVFSKKGFTLIEMIVVIAIIGVLAAILVPTMVSYSAEASRVVCAANMDTIVRLYKTENVTDPALTLSSFLPESDKYFADDRRCPSGGTYETAALDGAEVLVCTYHNTNVASPDFSIYDFTNGLPTSAGSYAEYAGGVWKTVTVNGKTVAYATKPSKMLYDVPYESYSIEVNVSANPKAGIIIEADPDTGTAYGLQIENGVLALRQFTSLNQDHNSYYLACGTFAPTATNIRLDVRKLQDGSKEVTVYSDDTQISTKKILLPAGSGNVQAGVRSWSWNASTCFENIKISQLK